MTGNYFFATPCVSF